MSDIDELAEAEVQHLDVDDDEAEPEEITIDSENEAEAADPEPNSLVKPEAEPTVAIKTKKSNRLNRLTLQERIKIVRLYSIYKLPNLVQKVWKQEANPKTSSASAASGDPGSWNLDSESDSSVPPSRKTIVKINRKFDQTGTVADCKRTGRPKTSRSDENIEKVMLAIQQDPSKSVRGIAKEVGLNKATVHRIKQEAKTQKQLKIENDALRDKIIELEKRLEQYEETKRTTFEIIQFDSTKESRKAKGSRKRANPSVSASVHKNLRNINSATSIEIPRLHDGDPTETEEPQRQSRTVTLDVPIALPAARSLQLIPVEDGTTTLTYHHHSEADSHVSNNGSETLVFNIQGPDGEGFGTAELILPYSEPQSTSCHHSHDQDIQQLEIEEHESAMPQLRNIKVKTESAQDGTITAVLEMLPTSTQSWVTSSR